MLPEGWVDHARSASTAPNNGSYGAHFWIKRPPAEGQWLLLPGAPESTFAAEGAYFQTVAIPPTLDLVAVRLGDTQGAEFGELKASFGRMLGAFPEAAAP